MTREPLVADQRGVPDRLVSERAGHQAPVQAQRERLRLASRTGDARKAIERGRELRDLGRSLRRASPLPASVASPGSRAPQSTRHAVPARAWAPAALADDPTRSPRGPRLGTAHRAARSRPGRASQPRESARTGATFHRNPAAARDSHRSRASRTTGRQQHRRFSDPERAQRAGVVDLARDVDANIACA